MGFMNFLWQVILGKELARRFENFPDAAIPGFTGQIMTTLIVSDLWLRNVEIVLADVDDNKQLKDLLAKKLEEEKKELESGKVVEKTEDEKTAEVYKMMGNTHIANKKWDAAITVYTKALELTPKNAIILSNRAAAHSGKNNHKAASLDAQAALEVDPTYAKAWSRLGLAEVALGNPREALDAYENGILVSFTGATPQMKQGLEGAKSKVAELDAKEKEETKPWDAKWDIKGKQMQIHSLVHESQVEGLLKFAESLKWPYLNETRDVAEDVYSELRGGETVSFDLWDWLFGLVLPGKWTAYKMMIVLLLCTLSLSKELGVPKYFDCGISLPKRSY